MVPWPHKLDNRQQETSDMIVLHAVSIISNNLHLGNTQSGIPDTNSETRHGDGSVMVWATISWCSVGPITTLHGQITAKEVRGEAGYFWKIIPVSERTRLCPHSHNWKCSVMVRRAWSWTWTFSLSRSVTRFQQCWNIVVSFGDWSEEQIPNSNISKATWRRSSRGMVYNSARNCSKRLRVHSKKLLRLY
jgi:hypothetical protein